MTATRYHHIGMADDFVIDHPANGDPNSGVVIVRYPDGHTEPEAVGGIEPVGSAGAS